MDNAESNANAKPNEPPESRALRWFALLSALGILAADFFVIGAATSFAVSASIFRTSQWNWFGKLASILFSCALLACSPWLRQNVGLRWRQAPGSFKLSAGCFVVFLGCAIGLGFLMPPAAFSVDTLLFQFFIPAIDEELLLRGIMLALLECAFGQSPMSCQLRFGYASLVISLFFGMAHAISFEDGQIHFAMLIFSITTIWARSWPWFAHDREACCGQRSCTARGMVRFFSWRCCAKLAIERLVDDRERMLSLDKIDGRDS